MNTIGDVLTRMERTYLYPPDHQPIICRLGGVLADDGLSVPFTDFAVADDENLLRMGSVLEIDKELVRVTDYDDGTGIASIERGLYGTTAAAYLPGELVILAPPYPKQSQLEAAADAVLTLYPRLYTVKVDLFSTVGGSVIPMQDDLAVDFVEAWPEGEVARGNQGIRGRIVDFHQRAGGRALLVDGFTGQLWVRYRRRMGNVTSYDDTLDSLGVHPRWTQAVIIGILEQLFAGRDIPKSQVEYLTDVFQAEAVPIGTRLSLSVSLGRYLNDVLLPRLEEEMNAEYKVTVDYGNPVQVVDGSVWV